MKEKSITALVSAFSRAYHSKNNEVKIFDDTVAEKILTHNEYEQISKTMAEGIGFFNPSFSGTQNEALRWIVDNQLSPSPLGRAAFTEQSLCNAVRIGALQYVILGAGYDTFAYRQPIWAKNLQIFELDQIAVAEDKRNRLKNSGISIPDNLCYINADFTNQLWQDELQNNSKFDSKKITFCSLLGVTYYISKDDFKNLISSLSGMLTEGSSLVFDYPDDLSDTTQSDSRAKKQTMLAKQANEKMCARYSYNELEKTLAEYGFLIYEHLTPSEITEQYFADYNKANPQHIITAFDNVNYCLAVKK